jgi:RNA polymerase sigma-70 factor (ECF subfamily)
MSTSDSSGDANLLSRLRDRQTVVRRNAERELFERFHAPIERMLRRLLSHETDDCVQEVFIDVFRGLQAFEGRSKLSTWVYRVALRRGWKCLSERRSREKRADPDDGLVEHVPADGETVVIQLETAELARRFEQALERLDLDQRTVMALSAIDGLDPPEIADVLGVPLGTVHSRLHRARKRMREWLRLT